MTPGQPTEEANYKTTPGGDTSLGELRKELVEVSLSYKSEL